MRKAEPEKVEGDELILVSKIAPKQASSLEQEKLLVSDLSALADQIRIGHDCGLSGLHLSLARMKTVRPASRIAERTGLYFRPPLSSGGRPG